MYALFEPVAAALLLTLLLGLVRTWRGPTAADRMLSAQLFGTTGVALLLVLAEVQGQPVLRDVALVLALLAVVMVVAFVTRVGAADTRAESLPADEPLSADASLSTSADATARDGARP